MIDNYKNSLYINNSTGHLHPLIIIYNIHDEYYFFIIFLNSFKLSFPSPFRSHLENTWKMIFVKFLFCYIWHHLVHLVHG